MKCIQALKYLRAVVDREDVVSVVPEEVSTHLVACSRCGRKAQQMRAYRVLMNVTFSRLEVPRISPDFTIRCLRAIRRSDARRSGLTGLMDMLRDALQRIPTPLAVTSSFAFAVVLMVGLFVSRGFLEQPIRGCMDTRERSVPAHFVPLMERVSLDVQGETVDRRSRELLSRFL